MFYPKTPFLRKPQLEKELLKINVAALPELLEWLCQAPSLTTYRVNTLTIDPKDYLHKLEQTLVDRFGQRAPKVFRIPDIPEMMCIDPFKDQSSGKGGKDDKCQPSTTRREIIVDTSCGAALLRGSHIYAPGVLAMETGTQLHECVDVYADVEGNCKRGTATRYESSEKIFIGIGIVKMQRYQLYNNQKDSPSGIAIQMQSTVSGVPSLGDLSDAYGLLQNLPSMVCVRVLNPQPGDRVLDMCAAPGNKTSHIAELMRDQGVLVALDNSKSRIKAMQSRIGHYKCIQSHVFDSTKALAEHNDQHNDPPFSSASFDRILLDAPCSGIGNRPQLSCASQLKTAKDLKSYPNIQRRLFGQAVHLLRPGGTLVYSTCTVTEAECEEIVEWALRKFPEIHLLDAVPRLGHSGLSLPNFDQDQAKLLQRFGPGQNLDTVGFFIAKFGKTESK
ncbi:uncharacterized protein Dwil_GK20395 [Drosophila willistoni]|uniref:tRNA (cytosine(72)-C(5))-methyltransferase NSUN6 n=1 Tax=Drosophila willistoni TaxID=7260 RepID=UPI000732AB16|nr:tRNA (cytosine(72)-C(5))-methyltransferase NSUN6 [Drosophila willistoni]XP_023033365.1 tRNA (cytosine(72)-C(5))-methyltransferase NSUN6 [Drosophila willistoni]EDW79470.2 uncharacterized protein Dwil_GK20395 [Drosophila willistoni]